MRSLSSTHFPSRPPRKKRNSNGYRNSGENHERESNYTEDYPKDVASKNRAHVYEVSVSMAWREATHVGHDGDSALGGT